MFGIRPEMLERLRKEYPVGTRVELVQMDDCQAPPAGTHGTVTGMIRAVCSCIGTTAAV